MYNFNLHFSKNGQNVSYLRAGCGGGFSEELYISNIKTLQAIQVTTAIPYENDENPSFDGTNQRLVFSSTRITRNWGLFTVNIDGSNLQPFLLPSNSNISIQYPTWSYDSLQICFVITIRGTPTVSNIHRKYFNDQTNQTIQLTNSGSDTYPAWSPDGKQIIFSSRRNEDTTYQIYIMDSDGTNQRKLFIHDKWSDIYPIWSPDGTQIAFQASTTNNTGGIFIVHSDGTNLRQLTNGGEEHPGWG